MLPIAETNEMKRPHLRGRFAPSPSGRFHIGNIFASLIAALVADEMVLRIEDLDPDRSKQQHIDTIMRDLTWFGFEWVDVVVYQSAEDQQEHYLRACEELEAQGLVYPCFCTALTCIAPVPLMLGKSSSIKTPARASQLKCAVNACLASAMRCALMWLLLQARCALLTHFRARAASILCVKQGFIIKRSDGVFAYQLAVVVDDAASGYRFGRTWR